MIQVGRRIIFEKLTGKIIMDMGEMQGDVLPREEITTLDFIDLPYGEDLNKFIRVKKYHIDPVKREVIFDELYESVETKEEKLERENVELEDKLLKAKEVI